MDGARIVSGVGTKRTGYSGPEDGPFMCVHCSYFRPPDDCTNASVIADPQVSKEREASGKVVAEIHPYGCCNLYEPKFRFIETKFSEAFEGDEGSFEAGMKE